jgi:hypothetical protein
LMHRGQRVAAASMQVERPGSRPWAVLHRPNQQVSHRR